MPNRPINVRHVAKLRHRGLSWKKIGIELARIRRRKMPYQPMSVYNALRKHPYVPNPGPWIPRLYADPLLDKLKRAHGRGAAA